MMANYPRLDDCSSNRRQWKECRGIGFDGNFSHQSCEHVFKVCPD